jgi:hypothetical protein
VYGPLALAATSVIYEGVPTYPDAGRAWRIAERLGRVLVFRGHARERTFPLRWSNRIASLLSLIALS